MMPARPTIVCAVDGSPGSGQLARISARLAEVLTADLECVHVLAGQSVAASLTAAVTAPGCPLPDDAVHDEAVEAEGMLDGICDAADAGFASRRVVRYGDPARRVAAVADEHDADLIVVGTRGDSASPDAVLGGSLMLVSIGADAAVSDAEVARRLQAGAARGLGLDTPLEVRRDVRRGDPAWELECVASAATAPVIVIGSRGLGPLDDGLLGTVARRVLRAARRPILIFPATSSPVLSA